VLVGCDSFEPLKYNVKMLCWPTGLFDGDTSIEFSYNTNDYTIIDADNLLNLGNFMSCKYFCKRTTEDLNGEYVSCDEFAIIINNDAKTINGMKTLKIG
jgi:hypothetical protein